MELTPDQLVNLLKWISIFATGIGTALTTILGALCYALNSQTNALKQIHEKTIPELLAIAKATEAGREKDRDICHREHVDHRELVERCHRELMGELKAKQA